MFAIYAFSGHIRGAAEKTFATFSEACDDAKKYAGFAYMEIDPDDPEAADFMALGSVYTIQRKHN